MTDATEVRWRFLDVGPQPPQEDVDKWERAVKEVDPSILTTEDRLKMLRRWPLDKADYYCNAYVGSTTDGLVQKAARTDSLTEMEAIIILNTPFGNSIPEDQKYMGNQRWWSPNTKKKFQDALNLLLTVAEMDSEKKAHTNAEIIIKRIKALRKPELRNFSIDDLKNITRCNKLPWVEGVKKHLEQQPAWGFVCLRTSFGEDSSWEQFKEFFIHATESALVFPLNSPCIWPHWKIQWIEDQSMENASVIDLCSYFRRLCEENKIDPGLRHDAFLYANTDAIESVISCPAMPSPAFVMAAQAAYDGTTSPDIPLRHADFAGAVRIFIPHVYTTFWARLISTEEDLQQHLLGKLPRMRHTWGEVFACAQFPNEQTYPTKPFFMG
ncbi:uncharacterized protein PGRI_006090 [Penicillium griseofulvum]|uniref:Uncharacterized protein n=1 Tax=Penicillium patulum TaxID=5078 RepID=A0A135LX66_PENPA|nr:uncharacterized protein PGRI_006090 [Penicillium griseofulvum]KXG53559.1 hypothetical protein PGRI_006090 [Penicillium griseofulvum]